MRGGGGHRGNRNVSKNRGTRKNPPGKCVVQGVYANFTRKGGSTEHATTTTSNGNNSVPVPVHVTDIITYSEVCVRSTSSLIYWNTSYFGFDHHTTLPGLIVMLEQKKRKTITRCSSWLPSRRPRLYDRLVLLLLLFACCSTSVLLLCFNYCTPACTRYTAFGVQCTYNVPGNFSF